MKKTQIKDNCRNITKQFVSYVSIVVISMLAVTAFLGIHFSADALTINASDYFNKLKFRDFEITSNMLITQDDIESIKNLNGISDAEGVYSTTAKLIGANANEAVTVISVPDRIGKAELREGRMPESVQECALECEIMQRMGLHVGDNVKIGSASGGLANYLLYSEFMVTGSFVHADHYAYEKYSGDNRYVIVPQESFDTDSTQNCFMKALVRINKPDNMRVIGKKYDNLSSSVLSHLEELAKERSDIRYSEIKDMYIKKINQGQEKLDSARQKLTASRKKIDENNKLINENEKKLTDGKKKLENGKKALADGKKKLDSAKNELANGRKQLDEAKKALEKNKAALDEVDEKLIIILDKALAGTEYEGNTDKYVTQIKDYISINEIDDIEKQIEKQDSLGVLSTDVYQYIRQYSDGLKQYNKVLSEYNEGEKKYNDAKKKIEKAEKQYNKGLKQYIKGLSEYRKGKKKLDEAKEKIKKAEDKYNQSVKAYEEGERELEKLKTSMADIKECRWMILNAECNPGYIHAKSSAENIRNLALTFSLLFVMVGVLVIYATMARIINEQRKLVGTVKALGFFNLEAAMKYLMFGISSAVLGMISGTAIGYFALQKIALTAHNGFYVTPDIPFRFNWIITAGTFLVGILITVLSVLVACGELIKSPAVELMKDKLPTKTVSPVSKKSIRTPLYTRLVLRNMRTDIRRICVTIVSIAGCCALLVIGFTLQNGITTAVEKQYHEILQYDHRVSFDRNQSKTAEKEIEALLDKNSISFVKLHSRYITFHAGNQLASGMLMCANDEDIAKIINLTDPHTGKQVIPGKNGVCIMRRTAEYYHIEPGDSITLFDSSMTPYDAKVEGIYQNYTGIGMVMSADAYKATFGKKASVNSFFLKNCKDTDSFSKELKNIKGFSGISSNVSSYKSTMASVSALRYLTLVLIVAAGVMAYFILLNLENMHLNQKKRELTVMRINGFTTKEVIMYLVRETIATTIIGIILGIAAGAVFGYFILRFIEQRNAGFYLVPSFMGWILSAVITAIYSFAIYSFSLRKIKYLKLTDMI